MDRLGQNEPVEVWRLCLRPEIVFGRYAAPGDYPNFPCYSFSGLMLTYSMNCSASENVSIWSNISNPFYFLF